MHSDKKNCCLFLIIISESLDLILDQDFYYEITYGSHSDINKIAKVGILFFAVWGTILYFITVISLCVDYCCNEEEENPCTSYFLLLSTCTEDSPQIALAIIVAGSTSHLISKVQIAKAVYGVIEPLIRSISICKERGDNRKMRRDSDVECAKFFDMCISFMLCLSALGLFLRVWFFFVINASICKHYNE